MTTADLRHDFQNAINQLRQLREEVGMVDLDLEEGPQLRADARRFAMALETAANTQVARALLLADRAGAQAFWYLVRTHWETMETFLVPSAFELTPRLTPFEALCRCEWSMDGTSPFAASPEPEPVLSQEFPRTLEWELSGHSGEVPGVIRPVRVALELPEMAEVNALDLHLGDEEMEEEEIPSRTGLLAV